MVGLRGHIVSVSVGYRNNPSVRVVFIPRIYCPGAVGDSHYIALDVFDIQISRSVEPHRHRRVTETVIQPYGVVIVFEVYKPAVVVVIIFCLVSANCLRGY